MESIPLPSPAPAKKVIGLVLCVACFVFVSETFCSPGWTSLCSLGDHLLLTLLLPTSLGWDYTKRHQAWQILRKGCASDFVTGFINFFHPSIELFRMSMDIKISARYNKLYFFKDPLGSQACGGKYTYNPNNQKVKTGNPEVQSSSLRIWRQSVLQKSLFLKKGRKKERRKNRYSRMRRVGVGRSGW